MKVCTVDEMRRLDGAAVEGLGIPIQILMENSGGAVCNVIREHLGVRDKRFVVLCGTGHNGGDGLVAARKLLSLGADVDVLVLGEERSFRGPVRANYDILARMKGDGQFQPASELLADAIARADVIVDALLGTGIEREVEGRMREAIERINASGKTVVSVDIPSGINGDTGQIQGAAVFADYTVTFGLPKIGNLLYPGGERCGELFLSPISYPPQLQDEASIRVEINMPPPLPPRKIDGHKGSFGRVLVVGGAAGYYGAPTYAALSLLKAGGGYARLATPRSVVPAVAANAAEVVFLPLDETDSGVIALGNAEALLSLAGGQDLVVIGPGLSTRSPAPELARRLVRDVREPVLIDGDGITAVAEDLDVVRLRGGTTIMTPHPAEMGRLARMPVREVLADPIGVARRASRDLAAIIVLKGARSVIAYPDGRVYINVSGNSGMATAGTGDVLVGTVGAMNGLGLPLDEAVRAAVFVHGLAGDLAAEALGEDGISARDVMGHLPAAVRSYRDDHDGYRHDYYGTVELV